VAENWRTAYLRQSRSDYEIFKTLLSVPNTPLCQRLHYLQMATEKLSKALMTEGAVRPARSHDAFVRFLQAASRRPEIRRALGYDRRTQFAAVINGILPQAQLVEDLSPEGPDHPNPEYPWESGGSIISPLDYRFPGLHFENTRMIKLMKFLERCFEIG
jgi:hypothetical protein